MAGITIAEAEQQPDKYQVCKNGVIRSRETGRFVAAGQNSAAFTQAIAKRANNIKRSIWEESFNAGIASSHKGSQELAIQAIGKNITGIATGNQGLPAVKAAAEVARLGGWVEKSSSPGTVNNTINIVAGSGLADLLQDIREVDVVIDGEYQDSGTE